MMLRCYECLRRYDGTIKRVSFAVFSLGLICSCLLVMRVESAASFNLRTSIFFFPPWFSIKTFGDEEDFFNTTKCGVSFSLGFLYLHSYRIIMIDYLV